MAHGFPRIVKAVLIVLGVISGVGMAQDAPGQGVTSVRVTSALRPELQLAPGEVRTHQLTIENSGDEAVRVEVTQVDFTLDELGRINFRDVGSQPESNAAWAEVASQTEILPGSRVSLPVTIETPVEVEPGTYWSMLLVEPADATTVEVEEAQEGVRTSVTTRFRYAVTLLTHVGEPAEPSLLFRDPRLAHEEEDGDGATLSVTLDNPTHFLASAEVWLELYDSQGEMVREVQKDSLRVYPSLSRRHTFELGMLDDQTYQAVIIADAGRDAVFGVRYDLDLGPE